MPKVPISSEVLTWAMDQTGLSPDSLAQRIDVDPDLVVKWINGAVEPYLGQLQNVAKATHRSWQFFLLPRPPVEEIYEVPSFRGRLNASETEANLQDGAVRQARRIQKIANWAGSSVGVDLKEATLDTSTSEAAEYLRGILDWTTKLQRSKKSKSQVFKELRRRVEDLGPVVLLQPAGVDTCRGFSLHDDLNPVIFLNSDYKGPSLRSFSLIHEMAHLLLGVESILCDYGSSPVEIWCNAVAAEFFLPLDDLRAYIKKMGLGPASSLNTDTVRRVSNYFHISWLASAIRLKAIGLADQATVDHVRNNAQLDYEGGFGNGGRDTAEIRQDEYGTRYPGLLFGALDNGRISEYELTKMLRANSDQLASLRSSLPVRG